MDGALPGIFTIDSLRELRSRLLNLSADLAKLILPHSILNKVMVLAIGALTTNRAALDLFLLLTF
jgi:hypothetical protein